MMTDAVQLKDAWVINIGVRFAIFTKRGFNKNEVMLSCVNKLKTYFHIDKWQINQPIILSDITSEILSVDGVATIVKPQEDREDLVIIENKWGSGYSSNLYDVANATFNGVVYPSVDPAIFEIKYPDTDIRGRVMGDI
jgi:phage-related baseplate assembly protein